MPNLCRSIAGVAMALGLAATVHSGHASAASSVQQILDRQYGPGVLDATGDRMTDRTDAAWTMVSSANTELLFEFAGFRFQNEFGVYDVLAPERMLPLFGGPASQGALASLSVVGDAGGYRFSVSSNGSTDSLLFGSSVFGFYLHTPQNNTFFSDTASNADHFDHFRAYAAPEDNASRSGYEGTSYLLAWEDLLDGGDKDYNDMIVSVSGFLPAANATTPVPLPAGLLLLGSGLLGLARLVGSSRAGVPKTVIRNM